MSVTHAPAASRFNLAALFFINAGAMGMWSVGFGNVLRAHGLEEIIGYAYACSGVAAFISPLAVGALADQRIPPTRLVRWLAVLTSFFLALTFTAIRYGWGPTAVLACAQMQAICAAPIFGLSTSIVLAALQDPGREYGPIRSVATLGWMASGWIVSFVLQADTSTLSGFAAAATWLVTAAVTFFLPEVPPLERKEPRDIFGLAALSLFANKDHRVVFLTAALFNMPMAAFYPFTPIHLRELGIDHATAAMSIGQISEIICMFGLARILSRGRLKWVFLGGIGFAVLRYALCAVNTRTAVLIGVSLHGFAFTLFFITAQLYLEQRVDPRMRVRAQALLQVMISGFGNLFGSLGSGIWRATCTHAGQTDWPTFWLGISGASAFVFVFFAFSYRGRSTN